MLRAKNNAIESVTLNTKLTISKGIQPKAVSKIYKITKDVQLPGLDVCRGFLGNKSGRFVGMKSGRFLSSKSARFLGRKPGTLLSSTSARFLGSKSARFLGRKSGRLVSTLLTTCLQKK